MSFNDTPVGFDHMKDDVTYGVIRDIANQALKAADGDPRGENLLLNILQGHGQDVVFMIRSLAEKALNADDVRELGWVADVLEWYSDSSNAAGYSIGKIEQDLRDLVGVIRSKLPAQVCVTPAAFSLATSAAVSSHGKRRVGQRER